MAKLPVLPVVRRSRVGRKGLAAGVRHEFPLAFARTIRYSNNAGQPGGTPPAGFSGETSPPMPATFANSPTQISFDAARSYPDPFNEVSLDVVFTDPAGTARKVPAFWAGGTHWKARYASPLAGTHRWRSECSQPDDRGLHGLEGTVEVDPYTGGNPLFRHGPLRVAADRRHLEHADGTPFFWLGDTWWMGLSHRLQWPAEFHQLAADRKQKGFNIVQIIAGLYPDMHPFDPRGANETGFPWEAEYARIRPEYFDAVDRRLYHLIEEGLMPCLVGAWGYFLPWMGVEKLKAHWRYLIARYGAWPAVWCAAGEANLPWYLSEGFPYDDRQQVTGWTEVLRCIRATDPFGHLLTIHPTAIGRYTSRHATDDETLLDFDLLQTPHGQKDAVPTTVRAARDSYEAAPPMPVINGEAAYEKLLDTIGTEWTRAMFWLCVMNGTKGHTYGANGIWQLNRPGDPHGPSPHTTGNGYGTITWEEAMRLGGSQHVAYGKQFMESLPWTELVPLPGAAAWVEPVEGEDPLYTPQACGIGERLRVVYVLEERPVVLRGLKPSASYKVTHFDPVEGTRTAGTDQRASAGGEARFEPPSRGHDWLLVLESLSEALAGT